MADIRSFQNIAQVEWSEPNRITSFQTITQVEWSEPCETTSFIDLNTEIIASFVPVSYDLLTEIKTSKIAFFALTTEISCCYATAPHDLYTEISAIAIVQKILDLKTGIAADPTIEFLDLLSDIQAAGTYLKDLKTNIEATFTTEFADLKTEIYTKTQKLLDLLGDIRAENQIIADLKTEISANALTLIDLFSDIRVRDYIFYDLKTSIEVIRCKHWFKTEIKAEKQILLDLHADTRTRAQIVTDLKSEIKVLVYTFHNLNTEIKAVRSKWWLNTEIIAGCSARWNFNTEWNPNRFLYTQIAAKKPYTFSFKTQSAERYAATEPSVEFKIPGYYFPLRTLFLDYIAVEGINDYSLELWWARGLIGKDRLKNVKIKAEYINTQYSGGYEVVTCDWLSCAINGGEYKTINETPLLLGDIQCDSYLNFSLKVECRDCSLSRGLIFFKLNISGDYKEAVYGDKIVYQDGSRYHAGEYDDYSSVPVVCRLYVVG